MNIAIVHPWFFPEKSGGTIFIYNLALNLNKIKGCNPIIYCANTHNKKGLEFVNGIKIRRLPILFSLKTNVFYKGLSNFFKEDEIDIINAHDEFYFSSFSSALVGLFYNIPIVLTIHNSKDTNSFSSSILLKIKKKLIANFVVKNSKEIITLTKNNKEKIINNYNYNSDYINVIPNGININNENVINKKNNYITFVGRLVKNKRPIDFLKLAQRNKSKKFLMIGNGPLYEKILLFKKNNNINNIEIVGEVDYNKIPKYYMKTSVLIICSEYEGFPTVALEAFSFGIPVVASNVSGNRDVIKEGYNGYLYNKGNITKLNSKLNLVIENYNKLSLNSKKFAQNYDWLEVANKTYEVFRNVKN